MICALRNPTYPVLFYHWLLADFASQETGTEARARLENLLFANDPTFRNRVSGMFGILKTKIEGLDFHESVSLFHERYGESLSQSFPDAYYGPLFFEYVRVRVSEWRERPQSTPDVPGGFDSDDIPF